MVSEPSLVTYKIEQVGIFPVTIQQGDGMSVRVVPLTELPGHVFSEPIQVPVSSLILSAELHVAYNKIADNYYSGEQIAVELISLDRREWLQLFPLPEDRQWYVYQDNCCRI